MFVAAVEVVLLKVLEIDVVAVNVMLEAATEVVLLERLVAVLLVLDVVFVKTACVVVVIPDDVPAVPVGVAVLAVTAVPVEAARVVGDAVVVLLAVVVAYEEAMWNQYWQESDNSRFSQLTSREICSV